MNIKQKYCGYITIVGKPNVGKSTLLNHIIKEKISIVSRKKNTTQKNIIGIKTEEKHQFIYIDTPGITFYKNKNKDQNYHSFQKIINNSALIIFIVDRVYWGENDKIILKKIRKYNIPIILLINKIDKMSNKNILLPYINIIKKKIDFIDIIPISMKKIENLNLLEHIVKSYLPKNPHIYPKKYFTTNSNIFTISEIIREQLILRLGDELPSIIKVKIESLKKTHTGELYIRSVIYVDNIQQKKIVIGKNGSKIKIISMISRYNIKKIFHAETHLSVWVKNKYSKK